MVSILAIIFLAIFASLSVAFFTSTSLNLAQSDNMKSTMEARLAAESGMGFLTREITGCGVSGSLRGSILLNSLAGRIKTDMNGTGNLGGSVVTYDGTTITIPAIALDTNKSFTATITLPAADTLRLTVTGRYVAGSGASAKTVQRQVAMDFHPMWEQALGHGLVSKGPIELGMNTDLSGVNEPSDGSIFSASSGVAVDCGSGHISGDISISSPGASLSLGGTTVDGNINYNAPPVAMPVIDRTPYKKLATRVVDSTTSFASGTFKNIRIKAGTNPVFGDVTIQGVMYIESPNNVQFTNNVNFTGVMVADDPAVGTTDTDNYIYFKNNMTFAGAENLPNTSEFTAVKQLQGAAVLCPGFTMEFKNNMSSVGGIMALKSLIAKNNLYSTVYGSMLIYGDAGLDFKNNSDLNIWLSNSSPPPGFKGHGLPAIMPDPTTYVEK